MECRPNLLSLLFAYYCLRSQAVGCLKVIIMVFIKNSTFCSESGSSLWCWRCTQKSDTDGDVWRSVLWLHLLTTSDVFDSRMLGRECGEVCSARLSVIRDFPFPRDSRCCHLLIWAKPEWSGVRWNLDNVI